MRCFSGQLFGAMPRTKARVFVPTGPEESLRQSKIWQRHPVLRCRRLQPRHLAKKCKKLNWTVGIGQNLNGMWCFKEGFKARAIHDIFHAPRTHLQWCTHLFSRRRSMLAYVGILGWSGTQQTIDPKRIWNVLKYHWSTCKFRTA